jgi:hypothetical protein
MLDRERFPSIRILSARSIVICTSLHLGNWVLVISMISWLLLARGGFMYELIIIETDHDDYYLDCVSYCDIRAHWDSFVFQIHEHMTREEMLSVFYTGHESGNNRINSRGHLFPFFLRSVSSNGGREERRKCQPMRFSKPSRASECPRGFWRLIKDD